MSDPAITIFEIVQEHIGRKQKAEWKVVQAAINQCVKANKGTDNKTVKQQVFAELAKCVSNAAAEAIIEFESELRDQLVVMFGAQAPDIAREVLNNNPELKTSITELICDTLGGLEHGLNEKQWKMVDDARRLLSVCYKIGERIGAEKTTKTFDEAIKHLLPKRF